MSFQITVLKVLAGHPGGQLSVADLTRAVALLMSSGRDWTDRTKRMLARAPDLDIFSQKLVVRDDAGWQITDAGLTLLASIEQPAAPEAVAEAEPEPQGRRRATITAGRNQTLLANRRLADEYDAAQERGEIARRSDGPKIRDHVPGADKIATTKDIGVTRKEMSEARAIRDAGRQRSGAP